MKRLIALLLALCLCAGMSTVLAEDNKEMNTETKTADMTVSLTVAITDSYTVVIPAQVTIDPETRYGEGTITLQQDYVLGGDAQKLYVRLKEAKNGISSGVSRQYSGSSEDQAAVKSRTDVIKQSGFQNFKMKTSEGNTCTYAIQPGTDWPFSSEGNKSGSNGVSAYWYATKYTDYNLISATSTDTDTSAKSCKLTFYVETLPTTGVYTDTLTFEIVTE